MGKSVVLRGKLILGLVLLVAGAACGSGGGAAGASDDSVDPWGRMFLSTEVTEGGAERPLVEGTRIRLRFGDDGRTLGADAGCNQMGGDARINDSRLETDDLATTEMGCDPDRHAQDQWLAGFLTDRPAIRLDGNMLTLTGDTQDRTTVVRFLDREQAEPDMPLRQTRWLVDTVIENDAASSVPAEFDAHLVFGDDNRFTGTTGCNSMGGVATVGPDDTLTFEGIATTKKACDPDRMRTEQSVLGVLDGEVNFDIDADRLTLSHPSGRGLGLKGTPGS